jgi:hypothetical protein
MSRPSRSSNRGRRRHVDSPETKRWQQIAETKDWLQPPESGDAGGQADPPQAVSAAPAKPNSEPVRNLPRARPPWLDPAEYEALLELRANLDEG